MTGSAPQVAIIGAGVMGASIAWHLSQRGARVTVLDRHACPAMGVTGYAFGWINLVHGDLRNPAAYSLLRKAVEEYSRLASRVPDAFIGSRRGSLVWKETPEETGALVAAHREHGSSIKLVDADYLAKLEPRLKSPPPAAAYSPNDIALNPARLTSSLLAAAISSGASMRLGESVTAIEMSGSRATGVRTSNATIPADIVIVAAGTHTGPLTKPLGLRIDIDRSPVFLLRYTAAEQFINGIVCGPDLEVRQNVDGSLMVAEGYAGEEPYSMGHRMLEAIHATFDVRGKISLQSVAIGERPLPAGKTPITGFSEQVDGLYLAVAHPGVILAPLLGRRAADEIFGRWRDGRRA